MSGETEASAHGWTIDTLHQHLASLISEQDRRIAEGAEAQDSSRARLLDMLQRELRELLKAVDDRHTQRSEAQDQMRAALLDRLQNTHDKDIAQVRNEVQTAFRASEASIGKSEAATEKRFDAVNEFRTQLGEQAATFMSRNEAAARLDGFSGKLDEEISRTNERFRELELRLTSRLDLSQGAKAGVAASTATLLTVAGLVVAIITVAITIIVKIH